MDSNTAKTSPRPAPGVKNGIPVTSQTHSNKPQPGKARIYPDSAWSAARELHRSGRTWDQIVSDTGIAKTTLRHRATEERWLRARDAVIVVQGLEVPTRIEMPGGNREGDQLRRLMVLDSLRTMERIVMRTPPRTQKAELQRADLTRTIAAQGDLVCGWSRQDQAAGAIVVGYASQVLGSRTADKGKDGT